MALIPSCSQVSVTKLRRRTTEDGVRHPCILLFFPRAILPANLILLVSPFGKLEKVRKDLVEPALGEKFWDWTLEQVKPYL